MPTMNPTATEEMDFIIKTLDESLKQMHAAFVTAQANNDYAGMRDTVLTMAKTADMLARLVNVRNLIARKLQN